MIKMETEVGERAAIAVSLLDADLAASRRLVSDLREALERRLACAEAAEAEAEFWKDEVERLRAARPDEALLEQARDVLRRWGFVLDADDRSAAEFAAEAAYPALRDLLAALDVPMPKALPAPAEVIVRSWVHDAKVQYTKPDEEGVCYPLISGTRNWRRWIGPYADTVPEAWEAAAHKILATADIAKFRDLLVEQEADATAPAPPEDGPTEAEELASVGAHIRGLTPGRYLLTVGEEEGAFGIRDFSVTGIDESIDVTRLSDLAALREENAKLQRALRIGISEAREFANADEVEFYAQGALCKAERDNAPGKAV